MTSQKLRVRKRYTKLRLRKLAQAGPDSAVQHVIFHEALEGFERKQFTPKKAII